MAFTELLEEIQFFDDEQIKLLVGIAKVMKQQQAEKNEQTSRAAAREKILEKYKGKGWIADDFDEPLDDFKEYM